MGLVRTKREESATRSRKEPKTNEREAEREEPWERRDEPKSLKKELSVNEGKKKERNVELGGREEGKRKGDQGDGTHLEDASNPFKTANDSLLGSILIML